MTTEYTDDPATWPSIKPTSKTKELQDQAIQAARDMNWMVCTEGNDSVAIVIAWSRGRGTRNGLLTNWCRVMTIIDGVAKTVNEQCFPTVTESGYVSTTLEAFKLNNQI